MHVAVFLYVFFFKQKTAYEMRISDWSSDVCSSDLVLSGHQDLSSALTFELDGQYSRRTSDMSFPSTTTANARTNGALFQMKVASWSVTPTMKLQLPSDWRLDLSGTIGRSQTNIASQNYVTGAIASATGGFYDNPIRAKIGRAACRERVCQYV